MAKQYIFTPFATVVAAYTTNPDKPYDEGGTPMYKIRLDPSPADLAEFRRAMEEHARGASFKVKAPKLGVSVSQSDGKVTLLPSSKFKPAIFDMKLNKLEDPKIGAGTIARAYCQLNFHDKGIGLQLVQIQIKTLVEWEGSGAGDRAAFSAGDGFVAETGSAFGATEQEPTGTRSTADALDI